MLLLNSTYISKFSLLVDVYKLRLLCLLTYLVTMFKMVLYMYKCPVPMYGVAYLRFFSVYINIMDQILL